MAWQTYTMANIRHNLLLDSSVIQFACSLLLLDQYFLKYFQHQGDSFEYNHLTRVGLTAPGLSQQRQEIASNAFNITL